MHAFDYKANLQRFELDKQFRAYISAGIQKVQRQIGTSALSINEGHPEFLFNGELYRTNGDVASVVKAFKAYRMSLQQFSLYASNNKIDHINTSFNLFWSLTLAAVPSAPELLTVVREEFMTLANQLSLPELMGIKSFDYQVTVLMHFIIISNLLLQEGNCEDVGRLLEYFMHWVASVLLQASLSPGQSLDNSRSIVKKDLCDALVLYYLLAKGLEGIMSEGVLMIERVKECVIKSFFYAKG
jgi:hypothetical protein